MAFLKTTHPETTPESFFNSTTNPTLPQTPRRIDESLPIDHDYNHYRQFANNKLSSGKLEQH